VPAASSETTSGPSSNDVPSNGIVSTKLAANGVPASITLVFKVRYKTDPGEGVLLAGSIPELGSWNVENAVKLKWSDHVWSTELTLPANAPDFEYKYVAVHPSWGSAKFRWEQTLNRQISVKDVKEKVICSDVWEGVRIRFSIFYPLTPPEHMYMTGDLPEIGGWAMPGPVKLQLGEPRPLPTSGIGKWWEIFVEILREPWELRTIQYRYLVMNEKTKAAYWEREPNRKLVLKDRVIVNGLIDTNDVNFVGGLLFNQITDEIFIGPYPQRTEDIDKMHEAGVTAVFDVQTDEDKIQRQIPWDLLVAHYKKVGVELCRFQIRDFNPDDLRVQLRFATKAFEALINNGKKVYVHCTAGMGRAPAVVVTYLCWVKKMEAAEAEALVKKMRPVAVPNMMVIVPLVKEPY